MDDIFESSVNLEDSHFREGYDEGFVYGLVSGKEEGCDVGLKLGFEVGEELGFYRGCVDVWTSAIRLDPTHFSSRVLKLINHMDDLIHKYPLMDPEDQAVQELMNALRLKFKMVSASLGVSAKLEYKGYPKGSASEGIEF